MYRAVAVSAVVVLLGACSATQDEPRPTPTASTVSQAQVDQFCANVADVLTRDGSGDAEDQAERIEELMQLARRLGVGAGEDMYIAKRLQTCEDELRAARAA